MRSRKARALLAGETKRGQVIRGQQTLEPFLLKVVAHQVHKVLFVINDEYLRGHSGSLGLLVEGDLPLIHGKLQPLQVSRESAR